MMPDSPKRENAPSVSSPEGHGHGHDHGHRHRKKNDGAEDLDFKDALMKANELAKDEEKDSEKLKKQGQAQAAISEEFKQHAEKFKEFEKNMSEKGFDKRQQIEMLTQMMGQLNPKARRELAKPNANALYGLDGIFVRAAKSPNVRYWESFPWTAGELNEDLSLHLEPYTEVEAHDLKSAVELNGKKGFIVAFSPKNGRYGVQFDDGTVKSLKRDNLTVVAAIKDFSEFPDEKGDVKSLMEQTERAVQITGRVQQEIVLPFKQEIRNQLAEILNEKGDQWIKKFDIRECGYGVPIAPFQGKKGSFGAFATDIIEPFEIIMCEHKGSRGIDAPSRRTNHSCSPNCILTESILTGYVVKIALRKIMPGEEITWNYRDLQRGPQSLVYLSKDERHKLLSGQEGKEIGLQIDGRCECIECVKTGDDLTESDACRRRLVGLQELLPPCLLDFDDVDQFDNDQIQKMINCFMAYKVDMEASCISAVSMAMIHRSLALCECYLERFDEGRKHMELMYKWIVCADRDLEDRTGKDSHEDEEVMACLEFCEEVFYLYGPQMKESAYKYENTVYTFNKIGKDTAAADGAGFCAEPAEAESKSHEVADATDESGAKTDEPQEAPTDQS